MSGVFFYFFHGPEAVKANYCSKYTVKHVELIRFKSNTFSPLIFFGVIPSLDSCVANSVAVKLYVCKLRVVGWGVGVTWGILRFRHWGMLTVRVCQRSPTGSWVNLAVVAWCDDEIIHIFFSKVQHNGLKRIEDICRLVPNDKALQCSSLCVRACVRGESPPQSRPSFKACVKVCSLSGSAHHRLCASLRTCFSCFNRSGSFLFSPPKRDFIRATGLFFPRCGVLNVVASK